MTVEFPFKCLFVHAMCALEDSVLVPEFQLWCPTCVL